MLLVLGPWRFGVVASDIVAGGEPEYISDFIIAVSAANFRGRLEVEESPVGAMKGEAQTEFFCRLVKYASGGKDVAFADSFHISRV